MMMMVHVKLMLYIYNLLDLTFSALHFFKDIWIFCVYMLIYIFIF